VAPLGIEFRADPDLLNTIGFLYFNARTEYILCVNYTVDRDSIITITGFAFAPIVFSSGTSASARLPSSCPVTEGETLPLHPHLPAWRPAALKFIGGGVTNCMMSPVDVENWNRRIHKLAVIQCDWFNWSVFSNGQPFVFGEPLIPAVVLDWNSRKYVIPPRR